MEGETWEIKVVSFRGEIITIGSHELIVPSAFIP
jgi:hypothetical protein